jgi:hypothetical protein
VVVDTTTLPAGYTPTYAYGHCAPSIPNVANVTQPAGGTVTDVNFGYQVLTTPTLAVVNRLDASVVGGRVVVTWRTISEVGSVAFYLYRANPQTGQWDAVSAQPIPAANAIIGAAYRVPDAAAQPGGTYHYSLVELQEDGSQHTYGPFAVTVGAKGGH